eukprot:405923_1
MNKIQMIIIMKIIIKIRKRKKNEKDLIREILHTTDYHDYLILLCCRIDSLFLTDKLPKIQSHRKMNKNDDHIFGAQILLSCIKNVIGATTIIEIKDIASRNPMLQSVLLGDIFMAKNQIDKITNTEKK